MRKSFFLFLWLSGITFLHAADFVQVTDAAQLQDGDRVVLACPEKGMAAGSFSDRYLSAVAVSFSADSTIILPTADTEVFTLGGTAAGWTLTNASGQKLGATAKKKMAMDAGTTTWTIAIEDGKATIRSTVSANGNILYNVNSPRFLNYTSNVSATMLLPTLFVEGELTTHTFEYADYPDKSTRCGVATYPQGKKVVLSKGVPAQEGKKFMGWLYDGKTYQPGDTFVMPAADVSLVAQWSEATGCQTPTAQEQAHKILRNNALYIVVGDHTYDSMGRQGQTK